MRKYLSILLVIICVGCCGVTDTMAQTSKETLSIYGLKSAPKVMREWSVDEEIIAAYPEFNPADYSAIGKAIEEGILEEMSTQIIRYEFTPEGKVQDWIQYSGNTPVKVSVHDMPGVFNVVMENGIPGTFTLDENEFQDEMDKGMIYLDAYNKGLSNFTITYDESGRATRLEGKALPFFGGGEYTESYGNYKFDSHGNWIKRTVSTPYSTLIQYRAYEY